MLPCQDRVAREVGSGLGLRELDGHMREGHFEQGTRAKRGVGALCVQKGVHCVCKGRCQRSACRTLARPWCPGHGRRGPQGRKLGQGARPRPLWAVDEGAARVKGWL